MSLRTFIAAVTLAGFAIICLIAFNIVEPTMDFDVHCTVHNYLAVSFGGACDMSTKTFITFFEFFVASIAAGAIFVALYFFVARERLVRAHCARRHTQQNFLHTLPRTLFEFFAHGRAASRRFA